MGDMSEQPIGAMNMKQSREKMNVCCEDLRKAHNHDHKINILATNFVFFVVKERLACYIFHLDRSLFVQRRKYNNGGKI